MAPKQQAVGSSGEGTATGHGEPAGGVSPAGHGAAPKPSAARARKERRQRKAMTCVLLVIWYGLYWTDKALKGQGFRPNGGGVNTFLEKLFIHFDRVSFPSS